jgi:hypothetical protein
MELGIGQGIGGASYYRGSQWFYCPLTLASPLKNFGGEGISGGACEAKRLPSPPGGEGGRRPDEGVGIPVVPIAFRPQKEDASGHPAMRFFG